MLRRHIACQRDEQAACLVRNKCRGRVTRGPYIRLRPSTYVTRSRPHGSVGSPPGWGAVAQADRSAPDLVRTRVVAGPPPGSCPGSCACSVLGPCCAWPEPCTGGSRPVQGSGHARGGSGPCSEVRSVRIGVRYFPWGSGPTVVTLVYTVFSGRVATWESTTLWGRVLFTMRIGVAVWAPRLHTVVRGTPVSGYRQWP
jgi:hypothetical protein